MILCLSGASLQLLSVGEDSTANVWRLPSEAHPQVGLSLPVHGQHSSIYVSLSLFVCQCVWINPLYPDFQAQLN